MGYDDSMQTETLDRRIGSTSRSKNFTRCPTRLRVWMTTFLLGQVLHSDLVGGCDLTPQLIEIQ